MALFDFHFPSVPVSSNFFTALSWPEVLPIIPVNFLELAKRRIPYKYPIAETGVATRRLKNSLPLIPTGPAVRKKIFLNSSQAFVLNLKLEGL
ncbi:hypothetical protein CMV_025995 [Castanea mollissima]|uniref:Uncharacterized protein n=1 Tax=Castanea mollissima TaxID=60419 RepID=A0A8J4QD79_9ROSI|nr:hypothetical protein CMV_025995 [Castanea mollissima]